MMTPPMTTESSPEWIDAAEPEERVGQVSTSSRLATHGPMLSAHGSSGVRIALRDLRRIGVWELTEPLGRATTEGIKDDVPSAEAAAVWHFDSDGSVPQNEYRAAGGSTRLVRVYHVAATPGDQRDQIAALDQGQPGEVGVPKYGAGDWVFAQFNNQSGRWEIIEPAEDLWRFELKTPLVPNADPDVPSTADAYLVVYDSGQGKYVRTGVEFQVADFLGTHSGPAGSRGYARRLADSHADVGWEILRMTAAASSSSSSA